MMTKAAVTWTLVIGYGGILLGLGLLYFLVDPSKGDADERARMLGQSVAAASLLPLGFVWVRWSLRVTKEREQNQST